MAQYNVNLCAGWKETISISMILKPCFSGVFFVFGGDHTFDSNLDFVLQSNKPQMKETRNNKCNKVSGSIQCKFVGRLERNLKLFIVLYLV